MVIEFKEWLKVQEMTSMASVGSGPGTTTGDIANHKQRLTIGNSPAIRRGHRRTRKGIKSDIDTIIDKT